MIILLLVVLFEIHFISLKVMNNNELQLSGLLLKLHNIPEGDEVSDKYLQEIRFETISFVNSPEIRVLYNMEDPELYEHNLRLVESQSTDKSILLSIYTEIIEISRNHYGNLQKIIKINYITFSSIILILTAYMVIKETGNYVRSFKESTDRENSKKLSKHLEYERNFIALELHDGAAQKLAAISRYLQEDGTGYDDKLIARYCSDVIGNIRSISHFLRSPDFSSFTLKQQLIVYFGDFRQYSGINLQTRFFGIDALQLKDEENLHIYRIIQELLSNGYKHSGADTISMEVMYSHPFVKICYRDNGTGKETVPNLSGMGSGSISYRIGLMNGSLKESNRSGYIASILIPVDTQGNEGL